MSTRTDITHCRQSGCAAAIVWATTDTGAAMPIDAYPNPEGNLAVWRNSSGELCCRVVTEGKPLYVHERPGMPHWSTCRNPPRRNR